MLDLENNPCLSLIDSAETNFNECTFEDKKRIEELHEAAEMTQKFPESAFEFDLGLSDYDKCLIDHFITTSQDLVRQAFDLKESTNTIEKYLLTVAPDHENDFLANHLAKVITRIATNILDSSAYDKAVIQVLAHHISPYKYYNLFQGEESLEKVEWHSDKKFHEIFDEEPVNSSQLNEMTYIFTLKGNSTLYYKADSYTHRQMIDDSFEDRSSYIIDSKKHKIEIRNIYTFDFGKGSVHLNGKYGTIHATPIADDRLLVIVSPTY